MKNLMPTLAVLLLLPASVWAGARNQLDCAAGSNDRACWDGSNVQSSVDVDGGGSLGEGASRLERSSSRRGSYKADVDVPCAKPARSHGRLGFLKNKKMMLGLLAAGGGGYFGYTHMAAFAGLGGPWGAAAMGAAAGLLLGMFILPKLFGMFHRHKKKD